MAFFQAPPTPGNQYDANPLLRDYLARVLPADSLQDLGPRLHELGARAGAELFELQGDGVRRAARPARAHRPVRAQSRCPALPRLLLLSARDDRRSRAHPAGLRQPRPEGQARNPQGAHRGRWPATTHASEARSADPWTESPCTPTSSRGWTPRPTRRCCSPFSRAAARVGRSALDHAGAWFSDASRDSVRAEAGARRFALTLGRTLELALLVDHAQWALDHDRGAGPVLAARRLAANRVDLITDAALDDAFAPT